MTLPFGICSVSDTHRIHLALSEKMELRFLQLKQGHVMIIVSLAG